MKPIDAVQFKKFSNVVLNYANLLRQLDEEARASPYPLPNPSQPHYSPPVGSLKKGVYYNPAVNPSDIYFYTKGRKKRRPAGSLWLFEETPRGLSRLNPQLKAATLRIMDEAAAEVETLASSLHDMQDYEGEAAADAYRNLMASRVSAWRNIMRGVENDNNLS